MSDSLVRVTRTRSLARGTRTSHAYESRVRVTRARHAFEARVRGTRTRHAYEARVRGTRTRHALFTIVIHKTRACNTHTRHAYEAPVRGTRTRQFEARVLPFLRRSKFKLSSVISLVIGVTDLVHRGDMKKLLIHTSGHGNWKDIYCTVKSMQIEHTVFNRDVFK